VVERAIVDAQAVLHEGAVVGGEGEITVVGHGLTIESERTVEPGARLEPSEAAAPKAS
jgi:hypothetical protein